MAKNKKRIYEKLPVRNREIRSLIAKYGIKYKEIAEECHISQSQLSQWLRYDLRDWQRNEILGAIVEIRLKRGESYEEEIELAESAFHGVLDSRMGRYVDGSASETVEV